MTKYRFITSTWTSREGHRDRKILMTGTGPEDAYIRMASVLKQRDADVKIGRTQYEVVR